MTRTPPGVRPQPHAESDKCQVEEGRWARGGDGDRERVRENALWYDCRRRRVTMGPKEPGTGRPRQGPSGRRGIGTTLESRGWVPFRASAPLPGRGVFLPRRDSPLSHPTRSHWDVNPVWAHPTPVPRLQSGEGTVWTSVWDVGGRRPSSDIRPSGGTSPLAPSPRVGCDREGWP